MYYTTLDFLDDYLEEPGMQKGSMGIITGLAVLMCLSVRVDAADFNAARFDTIAVMPFQNDTNERGLINKALNPFINISFIFSYCF